MTEQRHYRLASIGYLSVGLVMASFVGGMCCHREESFRGSFPGTEMQRAESLLYGVEMIRSTGREPTREDFDLPPDWRPPAGWTPPAGWVPPEWWRE